MLHDIVYSDILAQLAAEEPTAGAPFGRARRSLSEAPRGLFQDSAVVTFGRGDLSVCSRGGFLGAQEYIISNWRGVPQGSPQGQTLRAPLLRGTSVLR